MHLLILVLSIIIITNPNTKKLSKKQHNHQHPLSTTNISSENISTSPSLYSNIKYHPFNNFPPLDHQSLL